MIRERFVGGLQEASSQGENTPLREVTRPRFGRLQAGRWLDKPNQRCPGMPVYTNKQNVWVLLMISRAVTQERQFSLLTV